MTMRAASDDWALRDNLQLCGSVSPPTYADLRTAAHLQTFDVRDGSAALWGDSGKVFLVNVLHQSQAKPPKEQLLQHVTLDPPLQPHEAAEVEQIKLNASGSQVLLLAKSWIKVLRLPADNKHKPQSLQRRADSDSKQRFLVRFEDGSEQEVTLKEDELKDVDSVAEQVKRRVASGKRVAFVSREQSVAAVRAVGYFSNVRHAAWHPLSDTHLVVLSDAEEIEVFNTQQDVSKPEQRHRLDFPTKARATGAFSTCFCFGASIQLQQQQAAQMQAAQIWDAFTCYVLRSDGAVYALCPLVPYDCCASKTFLQILSTEVDAQIAVCKQKVEAVGSGSGLQSRLLELKSQKYWLQEGWAPASTQTRRSSPRFGGRAQTPPGRNDKTNADAFCYLSPHVSGISPDTWPIALQGPVDVTPQSVVEGKNQLSGGSSATSLLVVPHASRNSADKRPVSASPFLMRTFTSGHVELILLDAPIRPQWRSNRQAAASSAMRKLPALLLECLNLGIDDSGGKAVLERDIADPRLIYCPHSTGVHVINVSWVFALTSGKKFTELPKSSVRHVFSVSPSLAGSSPASSSAVSNVVGARVLKNVNFGHLLLLRLASGSFEVVNVSAASSELLKGVLAGSSNTGTENLQKTLPDTLASMASSKSRAPVAATSDNSSDGGIRPFGDIVEEKLEALSARGTRVTGSTLMHEVDDAVLAFVLERVKILYEDVEYIDEMDQLMRDRLQLHATMLKTQAEKVVAVQKNADDVCASMKKLQEKMERALAVQQNLSKRAAAVLQAVKENQPHLSRAEREFKSELELMAVEVRRMKPRVAEMTVQGQRAVRSLGSAALSASSSRRYWSPLSATGGSSVLSNDKKKMCYDVLRAETQLIDDTKVLLDDLSANLQQLEE
ncbi:hypothetical protein PC129_g21171 [Phytophthora cactorum]|uniref:Uncharacterized protein n=1 Tax=Phytophthora cactorum TaxID=29920 RepID=A0A329S5W5_9STRA|nr:hypothetical protein Pcac1_g26277 [Phytophthora cactorum]KAG2796938.1 hypothetical protein PC111_g21502 [Phytophthora cactorum]KAG2804828.1 hypothetical protein PC112_g18544 [Phytophthora cactorum]KAG2826600.1 hypothetical protein PC113_g21739 [Phytophthora cactorum]KAG2884541.1 hypothetical protein PC115_g21302 [Phytophthora cactorum]